MFRLILILVGGLAIIGLLVAAGFYIAPKDVLKPADAIVVVSGGDTTARTLQAVKLFQEGWSEHLIFSGAANDPKSPSNAAIMSTIAVSRGVPPDVITLEEKSLNTHQNANEVGAFIEALRYDSIILVTSPYHQRRTAIEFKNRLGPDIEIINQPAPDRFWDRRWWWISPAGWYLTVGELGKILFALLNQRVAG